jgi:hypothetical protein
VIAGIVRIAETPVAFLPVSVGMHSLVTDEQGQFSIEVVPSERADVASGLLAVRYDSIAGIATEMLEGTGAEISAIVQASGGMLVIDATQRVKPEQLCYVQDPATGAGFIRFPFTNRFGSTLTVESDKLNALTSLADPSRGPDQEPYPLADFESTEADKPDGYLGFEWSVNYFAWFDPARNSQVVSAQWKLINETVSLDQPLAEVPLCPSPALLDRCSRYSTQLSNRLYSQMFSSVTRLSQLAEKAAQRGKWKNRDGRFRNPYLGRAAQSLRNTRKLLSRIGSPAFICAAGAPQGCSVVRFPKAEVLTQFDLILKVKLPKELKFLNKALGPERAKFLAALREQPDSIVVCQR